MALCRKVSPSSLVTCTLVGLPAAFIPSRIAARTWSMVVPVRICSAGSTLNSRQRSEILCTLWRSSATALVAASSWLAAAGAPVPVVCCCPAAAWRSSASISSVKASISLCKASNCALSSAVSSLPAAPLTSACCAAIFMALCCLLFMVFLLL